MTKKGTNKHLTAEKTCKPRNVRRNKGHAKPGHHETAFSVQYPLILFYTAHDTIQLRGGGD